MFKQFTVAVAAAGLMLSAGAAFAKEDAPGPSDAPKAATSAKTRYCIKTESVTGTMIQQKVCKTLDQWRAEGVDPTRLKN